MICPICKKAVDESEANRPGSTYPFCSDRCKLIDLGRWLSGKYQIACDDEDAPRSDDAPGHEDDGKRSP